MIRRALLLAGLGVALPLAGTAGSTPPAVPRYYAETVASRTVDRALDGYASAEDGQYGCGPSIPDWRYRPGRIVQVLEASIAREPEAMPFVGVWHSAPGGSSETTAFYALSDVSRLLARERPLLRQIVMDRTETFDAWAGSAVRGDPRGRMEDTGYCAPGTTSADFARGGGYCSPRVPICRGGARDGMHAPLDLARGLAGTGNPYCPGGTVTPTPFDPSWAFLRDRAGMDMGYVAPFAQGPRRDLGTLCDGLVPHPSKPDADAICGAGYRAGFGGSAATAAAKLPERSIGRYLATHYGPAWPPGRMPVYYLSAANGSPVYAPHFMVDLRQPAAREWTVAKALDRLYWAAQRFDWMTTDARRSFPWTLEIVYSKVGWQAYYDPDAHPEDVAPGGAAGRTSQRARKLWEPYTPGHAHLYGPGEYETASGEVVVELVRQTKSGAYARNVRLAGPEAPDYRDMPMAAVSDAARQTPEYLGARRKVATPAAGTDVCAAAPRAVCNGPYATDAGGRARLVGRFEGPRDATMRWLVDGEPCGARCTSLYSGAPGEADPQAILALPCDGTHRLTMQVRDAAAGVVATCETTVTRGGIAP